MPLVENDHTCPSAMTMLTTMLGGNEGVDMSWRLLVIKSGGNQHYIFGTNKRRLNVGASYLLTLMPTWVKNAVGPYESQVQTLVCVSGVAELLVEDPETARAIVKSVTQQALTEAPGLEVWGWYEQDAADADTSLAERLNTALRRMEQRRSSLPSPLARNPMTPFSQRCPVTGQPAIHDPSGGAKFGPDAPVWLSPRAKAQHAATRNGLRQIANRLGEARAYALVKEKNLDLGVDESGWVAVIHADGNGFGQMLADLEKAATTHEEYPQLLREVSQELDAAAHHALNAAVDHVLRQHPNSEWLLPLIVGGDDLTALVDARKAREFVAAYLNAFETASQGSPVITKIARSVLGANNLTACAGVSIVKPTVPFRQAYDLAEELCHAAKSVKTKLSTPVSAFDVQVIHEATGRSLADIRTPAWGTDGDERKPPYEPYVTSHVAATASAVDQRWIEEHHADRLQSAISSLTDDQFTGALRHRVRTALTLPPGAYDRARDVLVAKAYLSAAPDERSWAPRLKDWFQQHGDSPRGLTAIDVAGVEEA